MAILDSSHFSRLEMSSFPSLFLSSSAFRFSLSLQSWLILSSFVLVFFLLRASLSRQWRRLRSGLPLPPGPKGFPVIGNLLDVPTEFPYLVYNDWASKYGDVIYFEALGQPMLVLNSHSAVLDLYEKRAPTFSDRPVNPAFEIMNYNWMFSTMSYNPWWRLHRRTFHQFFHQREIQKYRPILQQEALVFLRRLSANPKSFLQDTRWFFGSVIIWISYGVNDPEYNKSLIEKAEVMIKGFSEAALPGQFLVNVFPSLSYVPTWFPGAGWKKRLLHLAEETTNALVGTWNDAKERVRNGYQSEYPNVATGLIQSLPDEDHPEYADKEIVARNTSVISYAAGADTTVSSAHALFLALAMNPQVQLRAQEEIDAVVGTDRLPTPDDVARLPYIQAIVKELTRWHTVAPLGVPRISREDAEYRGYFIPKGTILFANTWAIMHNPEVFENPTEFNPERYLKDGKINPNVLDPEAAAFGYGRRICPGRYLSNEALGYFAASLLSVFDVKPPKDEFGNRVQLSLTIASPKELMATPTPFECEITPRSSRHLTLLSD